jgi:hypothetical protein
MKPEDKKSMGLDELGSAVITTPRPDPTTLTTAQLYREISSHSELFEAKLLALSERVDTSESASKATLLAAAQSIQTGLDKAEKSIVVSIDKVQNEQRVALTDAEKRVNEKLDSIVKAFDQSFNQHRVVDDEKFHSIETQFTERDKRAEQLSLADKTAVAAALQAQKESAISTNESNAAAIAKSEMAFTKQIDQIYTLVASMGKSTDDKINDIKGRLDRGEGHTKGSTDMWGYVVGAIGVLFGLVGVIALIFKAAR